MIIEWVSSSSYEDTVVVDAEITLRDQVKWQEDWLKTQLTPDQLRKYRQFMRQTELPRSKAVPQFIAQHNLIDWSQRPINLGSRLENQKVYALFKIGEKSILYGKYKGKYQRAIKLAGIYSTFEGKKYSEEFGYKIDQMRPLTHVYRASLELVFNNRPVVQKKDGYYLVDPITTKEEKVVQGGEQTFRIKLVIKKLQINQNY